MPRALTLSLLIALGLVEGVLPAQDPHSAGPPPLFERLPPVEEPWLTEPLEAELEAGEPPTDLPSEPFDVPAKKKRRGGMGPMGNGSPFGVQSFWIPSQNLTSQPGDLSMSGLKMNGALPVSMSEEQGIWLAMGGIERLEISTNAILPDSGIPVPDELWKVNVGAMHIRDLGDDWQTGGMLMVGSSSDQPFGAWRDTNIMAMGFLNRPAANLRDSWNFSLFYSPVSQLPFPIPGVAYVWRPSEQFTANIGVPFSLQYEPTETFSLSLAYTPLTNVNLLATQKLGEHWSVYGGYQIVNETFWLAERTDSDERFYMFDQRLKLGFKRELGWGFCADISAAYVFDREFFQADSFSGSRDDVLEIAPGVAGMLQVIWSR